MSRPSRRASVVAVLRSDVRRLARDRFLLGSAAYLVGVSLAMRWVLPWLSKAVLARRGFDLAPYHGLVTSYVVVFLSTVLVGMIGGFLLLESREDRTIRALLVSPLPMRAYLFGASAAMVAGAFGIAFVEALLVGAGRPPWPALVPITLTGALAAPVFAFYLATFATNKLEAFAHLKILGASGLILPGAYFLDPPWRYLAGLFPPYWTAEAWWIAEAGGGAWMACLLWGAVVSTAVLVLLVARFETVAGTGGI